MEFQLDRARQAMSIEEGKPFVLKSHPKYSSSERNR